MKINQIILTTFLICSLTIKGHNSNHFVFCDLIKSQALCPKSDYAQAVNYLPICCVDIFVFTQKTHQYFMVLRKQKPAQGEWWYPGGRLFKGESFFECAVRKCRDEVGLQVKPLAELGVYSTVFPDSEWNCQAHTVNIAVLAFLEENSFIQLDHDHEQGQWCDLNIPPKHNLYLKIIYDRAINYLIENNLIKN